MSPPSPLELAERLHFLAEDLAEPMTLDGLTRDFKIFQRRRGHRHSTDDLLTAWYAATHAALPVRTMLDLGTGIGTVGLALVWYFDEAELTAVEVQPVSFRLLRENVWANGVASRVRAIQGDLREVTPAGPFDLVTGSPPYFDVKAGIVSADPQRAGARFELCGDVRDYCRAAKGALAPGGRFVFCFPTVQRRRAERACEEARLSIVFASDVIPKEGLPALFSLFSCAHEPGAASSEELPMVVRDRSGAHTPEMTRARRLFGMAGEAERP
ncbi:MAG TPA: methyltransferase [Polyangiaceae bacterium]|nr:methyltransferase [Polyangiaceae bacterium]